MADLMSDKTTSFDSLAKKYNNFMVPAIKIKVQGTDIVSSLKLAVDNVSIVHSLDSAGSCNFTVVNAYDIEKRQFDSKIKSKLKLGTIIEVELGYGSSLTKVFKGYISELTYNFSDSPQIDVTLMDVRKLMMEANEKMQNYKSTTYSDAFSEVMKGYKKICTSMVIDKTTDKIDEGLISQTSSDYKFIQKELARKAEREFFVIAGKAYFRIPQKAKQPITTLTWGSNLISFSKHTGYLMNIINVIGHDEDKQKTFVGNATAKAKDPQTAVISKPQPTIISDPDATDMAKAKLRAKVEAEKRERAAQSGSGTCIGLPEIVPGRFIKIDKLDSSMNKKYYIRRVQHSFGSDGFTTSFDIGGWE